MSAACAMAGSDSSNTVDSNFHKFIGSPSGMMRIVRTMGSSCKSRNVASLSTSRHCVALRGVGKGELAPCPPSLNGNTVGGHASLCPPYELTLHHRPSCQRQSHQHERRGHLGSADQNPRRRL